MIRSIIIALEVHDQSPYSCFFSGIEGKTVNYKLLILLGVGFAQSVNLGARFDLIRIRQITPIIVSFEPAQFVFLSYNENTGGKNELSRERK